jgi:hypothetical protein
MVDTTEAGFHSGPTVTPTTGRGVIYDDRATAEPEEAIADTVLHRLVNSN